MKQSKRFKSSRVVRVDFPEEVTLMREWSILKLGVSHPEWATRANSPEAEMSWAVWGKAQRPGWMDRREKKGAVVRRERARGPIMLSLVGRVRNLDLTISDEKLLEHISYRIWYYVLQPHSGYCMENWLWCGQLGGCMTESQYSRQEAILVWTWQ